MHLIKMVGISQSKLIGFYGLLESVWGGRARELYYIQGQGGGGRIHGLG